MKPLINVCLLCAIFFAAIQSYAAAPLTKNQLDQKVIEQMKERDRQYSTTWAKERESQIYESPFINLWDDLRNLKYDINVMKNFQFNQLTLGKIQNTHTLENNIEVSKISGTAQTLDHKNWQQWIQQKYQSGYQLEQCEFHHKEFKKSAGQPIKSKFNFKLHVTDQTKNKRYIIKGELHVAWTDEKQKRSGFKPDKIDATNLTIFSRTGSSVYKKTFSARKATAENSSLHIYDLNNDGYPDIIDPETNKIFWNKNGRKFSPQKILDKALPKVRACILSDFDNDGLTDLIITSEVATNKSDLAFIKGTKNGFDKKPRWLNLKYLEIVIPSCITTGDIDNDGDLDLWLTQYKAPYLNGQMPTPYFDANDGFPSYLLLNDGGANFTDNTLAAGLAAKQHRRTYSASFIDLDNDNDLDLVTINDFSGIDMYLNNGKGKFNDVTATNIDDRSIFGMSHCFGDFNNDNKLDIFATGMASTTARRLEKMGLGRQEYPLHNVMRMNLAYGNRTYLQQSPGKFKQPAFKDMLSRSGWSWGCAAHDFDNDGDLEIYIANGHLSLKSARDYCSQFWCLDIYSGSSKLDPVLSKTYTSIHNQSEKHGVSWNGFEKNNLFLNTNGNQFTNVSYLFGNSFENDSRCAVAADFNKDGKQDLFVSFIDNNDNETVDYHIFQNNLNTGNNWVGVRLSEQGSGNTPNGAKIKIASNGKTQIRQIVTGDSYQSQHPNICHFGLGKNKQVDYIEVKLQNGKTKRIENPAINKYHAVQF